MNCCVSPFKENGINHVLEKHLLFLPFPLYRDPHLIVFWVPLDLLPITSWHACCASFLAWEWAIYSNFFLSRLGKGCCFRPWAPIWDVFDSLALCVSFAVCPSLSMWSVCPGKPWGPFFLWLVGKIPSVNSDSTGTSWNSSCILESGCCKFLVSPVGHAREVRRTVLPLATMFLLWLAVCGL